jgi:hypothetical protein
MNTPVRLSVSSILLTGILTGCSQQQIKPMYMDNDMYKSPQINTGQAKHIPRVIHKKTQTRQTSSRHNIGMPPAKPGQCYAKIKRPATYKTLTKRVLVKKAGSKRVLVRGSQYRWVNKKVLVKPASYTQHVIPAKYKTVNKRVMVKPSYLAWKKGKGLITKIDHATGEILCRIKVPAVYKNIKRKVLVQAARIIKTPHPAVYKTVKNKKLISPAQYKSVRTSARYKNKHYRVKTASSRYIWKQVVCETNIPKSHKRKNYKRKVYKTTHKKKFYKAKQHKAKTYIKKYSKKRRIMRAKSASHSVKKVNYKKAVRRKVTNSKRMATVQHVRVPQKQLVRKSAYKKIIKHQKAKVKTYRPSEAEAHAIRLIMKSKPEPVARKAIQANKPSPVRVVKKANKVNRSKIRLTKQNAILRIQTALTERGFNTGGIDGKLGPNTVSALTAFQRKNKLQTGKLTRETLRALELI